MIPLAVVVAAVLALAPAALAQSAGAGYGGEGGGVAGETASGGAPDVPNQAGAAGDVNPADEGGLLPFTGLDVALMVGGGLLLLAAGVALSRMVSRNTA